MNKEFIKKMLEAEQLRYEAIKEILPENIRKRVNNFEKDAFELIKEVALDMVNEKVSKTNSNEEKDGTGTKKESKKVDVDFM